MSTYESPSSTEREIQCFARTWVFASWRHQSTFPSLDRRKLSAVDVYTDTDTDRNVNAYSYTVCPWISENPPGSYKEKSKSLCPEGAKNHLGWESWDLLSGAVFWGGSLGSRPQPAWRNSASSSIRLLALSSYPLRLTKTWSTWPAQRAKVI